MVDLATGAWMPVHVADAQPLPIVLPVQQVVIAKPTFRLVAIYQYHLMTLLLPLCSQLEACQLDAGLALVTNLLDWVTVSVVD